MKKISDEQRDALSFSKRLLIRGILKHNVNIYSGNSLQDGLQFIIPSGLWSKQEDFIFSKIYQGRNIEPEILNTVIIEDYFIMAYTVYTEEDDDEVHFLYNAKDFSLEEVKFYRESDILEEVWR